LLWSSLCYDPVNKQVVLFGGGNVQTERGDPGTWVYNLADNAWSQLSLDVQPPPRANSRLAYDPEARQIVLFGGDRLDQLLADTWTFDVTARKWQQRKPELSADAARRPRAIVVARGEKADIGRRRYDYASEVGYVGQFYRLPPLEMWTY
jgi:hypothetical protein